MSTAFFPSDTTTPDHASANAMLAARKQQLAHLQTLQRQQQEVLAQYNASSVRHASPLGGYDGRDDRFTASALRSPGASASGATVTFRPASPRQQVMECDYDSNPTDLYLAVQRKDWEAATAICASKPDEASVWVSRREKDGKLRWRLLPLHAAVIFKAPERTISALMYAFAQGAACKDDTGMLPLHLAIRNGADEDVVVGLLMAYPQSIEVRDRKGRTPMDLATDRNSAHPNKDVYIQALERGAAYYAVASAAQAGAVARPSPVASAMTMPALAALPPSETPTTSAGVVELQAELAKTQETSKVLVDHVNSLEAQLASRSDTERFLATKIANLDSQLKETKVLLEAKGKEMEEKASEHEDEVKSKLEEIESLKVSLADKKEAELKTYKLTNKERFDLEERVETSEKECAAAVENTAILEEQLKKKIEIEQSLASQVSMLASQLASSASSSSEATTAYQRTNETLTAQNQALQAKVNELEAKLGTVATALDAMSVEQERIVEAATRHEKTMTDVTQTNAAIISDTTRQETLLEDAAKEREQIVSILMRQAEDAERTMADREKVLDAVKTQEANISAAAEERDAVIESVNKQREYMDYVMNNELSFLKRTASEEERLLEKDMAKEELDGKIKDFNEEKAEAAAEEETGDQEVEDEAETDEPVTEDEPKDDIEEPVPSSEEYTQDELNEAIQAALEKTEDDERPDSEE
mmetsp:Transcript_31218/g.71423  ORF Transcript_31218/g.71423 Transcript_31218/m.71423 type:complete len:706 (+) Transcript_31218:163-2280(+)